MDLLLAIWNYPLVAAFVKAIAVIIPVVLGVAYTTLLERKVLGYMHIRLGPNRVGPYGILQPFADLLKMLFKEFVIPSMVNRKMFIIAPFISIITAFAVFVVIPFGEGAFREGSVMDSSVLFVLAIAALGGYASLIAGWASNSKFAIFGAIRSANQIISYELALGFALLTVIVAAGSMNFTEIVHAQKGYGFLTWYFIPLLPMAVIYYIASLAELGRAPFAVVEGEAEIVAGFHVEYSGTGFVSFYLAEYTNMILVSALNAILFFGGWLSPFSGLGLEQVPLLSVLAHDSILWMIFKIIFFLFTIIWVRATIPGYRYDQIMRLGWKIFIPFTMVWLLITVVMHQAGLPPWFS